MAFSVTVLGADFVLTSTVSILGLTSSYVSAYLSIACTHKHIPAAARDTWAQRVIRRWSVVARNRDRVAKMVKRHSHAGGYGSNVIPSANPRRRGMNTINRAGRSIASRARRPQSIHCCICVLPALISLGKGGAQCSRDTPCGGC